LNEKYIAKTPEIVFEVISPSSSRRDEGLKFDIYEREGVKYYILIYPNELIAKVYGNTENGFRKIGDYGEESVAFEPLTCEPIFDFGSLFSRFRR
jgi:Uma2 family endonuclease